MPKFFLSLLLVQSISFAVSQEGLTEHKLPGPVSTAVTRNYDYGRHEHDFAGVAKIRFFRVRGTPSRFNLLKQIAITTESDSEGSLLGHCRLEHEISDPDACIRHLLEKAKRPSIVGWLARLEGRSDGDAASVQFSRDLATIRHYLLDTAGSDYVEYCVDSNVWSVDVMTSVLFNRDFTRAIVVTYDSGA